jgi:putative ABC transport system permease protein
LNAPALATAWRLLPLTLSEWRHQGLRHAVALLAVALGVALAYSVHLINQSALAEFSAAVRSANGQPDLSLRGQREGFDDALFARVAADARVAEASPVLEVETYLRGPQGERIAVRVLGIDALRVAALAPNLLPRPDDGEDRFAMLDPGRVFANAAARAALGGAAAMAGPELQLRSGEGWQALRLAGSVAVGGGPTLVMDLAGAQQSFLHAGRIARIDLRLAPGVGLEDFAAALPLDAAAGVRAVRPGEDEQRVSKLSRAYRVNLTVLALVALLVGAFLVYSVLALAVAQRAPQIALLGVLGLSARERRAWVLGESALIGLGGSVIGLALGALLAWGALRWLAGDLGGGYFPGVVPPLRWHAGSAAVFGLLGVAAAVLGGWWPARQAERLAPAQALKGLGDAAGASTAVERRHAVGVLALLAGGAALALLPPIGGLPLAAYASVACLLLGGVAAVPLAVKGLLAALPAPHGAVALLALERARFARHVATAAVAGVVASLALSVAITVMVASFREGVAQWLDQVLPAEVYARSAGSAAANESTWLAAPLLEQAAALPGVARVQASRSRSLLLAPELPAVTLVAQPVDSVGGAMQALPMVSAPLAARSSRPGVWVSEAMVALHGAVPGSTLTLPLKRANGGLGIEVEVLGVWRDYARQFGTLAIDLEVYRRLTGDMQFSELALWLEPGGDAAAVQAALRALPLAEGRLETVGTTELRALSLRIFDRSFAVTRYLQTVAIAIGLVGVAASLSAQVLARRKEFGLLVHLGLTSREIRLLVTTETAAWMATGVAIGLALGLAIAAVLVHVVNPQSFHWRMAMVLPEVRLIALALVVWLVGVATALMATRQAASRAAVLSVKEDW